jgi:hypothetical protein
MNCSAIFDNYDIADVWQYGLMSNFLSSGSLSQNCNDSINIRNLRKLTAKNASLVASPLIIVGHYVLPKKRV